VLSPQVPPPQVGLLHVRVCEPVSSQRFENEHADQPVHDKPPPQDQPSVLRETVSQSV
jgi:hypothetical protein